MKKFDKNGNLVDVTPEEEAMVWAEWEEKIQREQEAEARSCYCPLSVKDEDL